MISIILMVIAALVGFFFGAGMNEAIDGAILLSMITGLLALLVLLKRTRRNDKFQFVIHIYKSACQIYKNKSNKIYREDIIQ